MSYDDIAVMVPPPKSLREPAQYQDDDDESEIETPFGFDPREFDSRLPAQDQTQESEENDTRLVRSIGLSGQKCGERVVAIRCETCGHTDYKIYRCGYRTCPECAKIRQREIIRELLDIYREIHIPQGMWLKMVTLTLRKLSFSEDVPRAITALKKIYHNIFEKNGIGMVAHMEVAPEGMIHWHILYLGKYIHKPDLDAEWLRITGDSYITKINKVNDVNSGLYEVCKYITKFAETSTSLLKAFYVHIKHRRIYRTFGCFYDKELEIRKPMTCPACGGTKWVFDGIKEPDDKTWSLVFDEILRREAG